MQQDIGSTGTLLFPFRSFAIRCEGRYCPVHPYFQEQYEHVRRLIKLQRCHLTRPLLSKHEIGGATDAPMPNNRNDILRGSHYDLARMPHVLCVIALVLPMGSDFRRVGCRCFLPIFIPWPDPTSRLILMHRSRDRPSVTQPRSTGNVSFRVVPGSNDIFNCGNPSGIQGTCHRTTPAVCDNLHALTIPMREG